jgi:hypothetical protein
MSITYPFINASIIIIPLNQTEKSIAMLYIKTNLKKAALTAIVVAATSITTFAQNVFSGEPVQWVGRPNSYTTTPYNSDYRTTSYRKISTTTANPSDGRGSWATTINVQSSGGDVAPDNMPGGGGAGWLLISGPSGNRFQNKWNFNGVGQAALHAINGVILQGGGQDMGLDMSTAGYYTFSFRDAGYVNSEVYIGYTAAPPVSVSLASQTFSGGQAVINITTGATPSAGEGVFVRYRNTTNNFTAGTSLVEASGSGTNWSANIPAQTCGSTTYYYIFTSSRTLAQLNGNNDTERSFAVLRFDDNSGNNYSYTCTAPTVNCTGTNTDCIVTTGTASVTASGGSGSYTYLWSNAAVTSAISALAPGAYTATVTDANGCTQTCAYTVTANTTPPTAGITNNTGSTVLTCATTAINVTATGGGTYLWSTGNTNATINLTATGTYTVTVTDGVNGCTATANITITDDLSAPTVSASATPDTICAGSNTTLMATGTGVTYTWMPGALSGSTVAAAPVSNTTYTVTATGSNGCTATATTSVTVTANPIIGTTMKSDAAFVTTGTAGVTALPAGCTFLWAPGGETSNYIQNKPPGTYTVTVTAPGGCVKTRTIIIN